MGIVAPGRPRSNQGQRLKRSPALGGYSLRNFSASGHDAKKKIRRMISERMWGPLCRIRYARLYRHPPQPDRTIEIDVASVSCWIKGGSLSGLTFPGEIRDGDWDRQVVSKARRLAASPKYRAIYQRFVENRDWSETSIVEEFDILKQRYGSAKGFVSFDDYCQYYKKHDFLYESVQRRGVVAAEASQKGIAPIYVHIGRVGEIIYTSNGNHRLYMAMVLGIEKIPVRVWVRHRLWQEVRERVIGRDYQDLNVSDQKFFGHPDTLI